MGVPVVTRPMRILVVDDSAEDIQLLEEAMQEFGLDAELESACDGEQALRRLRDGERLPDLVLLDLNMPRRSGREVLEELKQDAALRSLPVIIFSTSSSPFDVEDCYDRHANSYLVKPIDFDGLGDVVRALDAFWFRHAALPGVAR